MEIKRGYYKTADNGLAFVIGEIPEHIGATGSFIGFVRPLGTDGYDSDWIAVFPIKWERNGKNTCVPGYDIIEYMGEEEVKILPKPRKKRGASKHAGNITK